MIHTPGEQTNGVRKRDAWLPTLGVASHGTPTGQGGFRAQQSAHSAQQRSARTRA